MSILLLPAGGFSKKMSSPVCTICRACNCWVHCCKHVAETLYSTRLSKSIASVTTTEISNVSSFHKAVLWCCDGSCYICNRDDYRHNRIQNYVVTDYGLQHRCLIAWKKRSVLRIWKLWTCRYMSTLSILSFFNDVLFQPCSFV